MAKTTYKTTVESHLENKNTGIIEIEHDCFLLDRCLSSIRFFNGVMALLDVACM